ncbi:MAG: serine/threonine protein kinase [Archangiaceae bacterium]|nr:serine/threonine protein kinase [Archangiaceae bacterium]
MSGPARVDSMLGQAVGGYTLEHRIGEGAIGIVYAGRKPDGATAAIKVVRPELAHDPRYALTVIAEARAVSTIGHPNIVGIFDLGLLADGRPYVVMELIDGASLEELLAHGPMAPEDVLEILDELFAALHAAHQKNVIHRDIKPANIYLAGDAHGRRVVKLLDFGLARLNFAPGSQASMVVGTPDYMAPEQASSKLTYASDLYAMGVVAFRMLTGHLPFVGQSTLEVIMAHVRHTPQKPSFLKPGLAPQLDALVLSLLEKSPDRRPASAEVARQAVAALRRAGALTAPPEQGVGDETLRPFVPQTPFRILTAEDEAKQAAYAGPVPRLSLLDDDEAMGKRTEPFKALGEHHPVEITERPMMSPFGGKPADRAAKPGNETIRDYAPAGSQAPQPERATELDHASLPARATAPHPPPTPAPPSERGSRGVMWALLALGALGAAAGAWLRFGSP